MHSQRIVLACRYWLLFIMLVLSVVLMRPQTAAAADRASVPSVCYEVHMAGFGWTGAYCDTEIAGQIGRRMEAIRIWSTDPTVQVCYEAHVQGYGWMPTACDGVQAGTTGQARRMEAIRIRSSQFSICYSVYAAGRGWMSACDGAEAGTTGQKRQLEAISIRFS